MKKKLVFLLSSIYFSHLLSMDPEMGNPRFEIHELVGQKDINKAKKLNACYQKQEHISGTVYILSGSGILLTMLIILPITNFTHKAEIFYIGASVILGLACCGLCSAYICQRIETKGLGKKNHDIQNIEQLIHTSESTPLLPNDSRHSYTTKKNFLHEPPSLFIQALRIAIQLDPKYDGLLPAEVARPLALGRKQRRMILGELGL